jgi:hypothetical protein
MKHTLKIFYLLIPILFSCKKDTVATPEKDMFKVGKIEGVSQKGPLLNGSSLTLYELNTLLTQTGNSFNSQILDNLGSFQINNISLSTQYAKLKADGFYFNEITNLNSTAPISLYAICDLTNKSTVNINLMSTLEVSRIEYLVGNGMTFAAAKKKAQQEVLKIFSIQKNTIPESETLNISLSGDDNAILLAISLILQGYRTEAQLTQLLGDINTDIRTDGVLNSGNLGSLLINDARLFNVINIRNNIQNRYASLGIQTIIPNFEKYITQFKDSTNYIITNQIKYPYIVNSKQNLLKDSVFPVLSGMQNYCIGAFLPSGSTLKIVIKPSAGYFGIGAAGPITNQNNGWLFNVTWPDSTVFNATGNNQNIDIGFMFAPPTSVDIKIYENGASTPIRTKTILSQ